MGGGTLGTARRAVEWVVAFLVVCAFVLVNGGAATAVPPSADGEPVLLAEHVTVPLGQAIELTPERPLVTIERRQAMPAPGKDGSLLVHLLAALDVEGDGELVLSQSVNGVAAVQLIIKSSRGQARVSYVGLVGGSQVAQHPTDEPVPVDAWNFAPRAAERPGRSFVTFRAEPNGDRPMPDFVVTISGSSALVGTTASEDELALRVDAAGIERNWQGALRIPIRLDRARHWNAQPTEVDVWITELDDSGEPGDRELAATVTLNREESSRVLNLPLEWVAGGRYVVDVAAPRSFNAPQATAAIMVTGLDTWRVVLGGGLVLVGLVGLLWGWWSRRRRWVLPAAFVVIGVLVLAVTASDFRSVRPGEVRSQEVDEGPMPDGTTVFDARTASGFDRAVSSRTALLLQATGAQLVAERRDGDTLVRVYELNPLLTRSYLAAGRDGAPAWWATISRSARMIGGVDHLRRGAVAAPMIHLELSGDRPLTVEAGYS